MVCLGTNASSFITAQNLPILSSEIGHHFSSSQTPTLIHFVHLPPLKMKADFGKGSKLKKIKIRAGSLVAVTSCAGHNDKIKGPSTLAGFAVGCFLKDSSCLRVSLRLK